MKNLVSQKVPAAASIVNKPNFAAALLLGIATSVPLQALALPTECGTLTQSWGPFDYRPERYVYESTYRSHAALLAIVENAHFTPEVEALIRGKTGTLAAGDLSYTLGVFPNHHRALISIANLGLRERSPKPIQLRYSVECYFQRAITFRSDDNMVRMIYANYLRQIDKLEEARAQIDTVAARNPDNAFTLRNIGLLYHDVKAYDKALIHAHKAMAMGLNVDSLKAKLLESGHWKDPAPESASLPAQ